MNVNATRALIGMIFVASCMWVSQTAAGEKEEIATRTVLLEQFTRQSCGICPGTMRDVLFAGRDGVIDVRFVRNGTVQRREIVFP